MTLPDKLSSRHYLLLVGGTLLILFLIILTRPDKSAQLREPVTPVVKVVELALSNVTPSLNLNGRIQPRLSATLSAEVSGRVVQRLVEAGERVVAGTPLLQLEEGDYRDALARAEAQLQQERAAIERDRRLLELAVENRQLQVKEVARLRKSQASVSRADEARQRLLQLQAEEARLDYSVNTATARLALRRAEFDRAQRDLERCRVLAPFSGTVNEVLVDVGDRIALNQKLLSLLALDALDFYAEMPGDVQTGLQLGEEVSVVVEGHTYPGRVVALQSEPDRRTHTRALRVRLTETELNSGALAHAQIPLRALQNVILAPVAGLLREDGKAYLFVEQGGQLSRRLVETGLRQGENMVILSGVEAGERIVARDVSALSDGQKVKLAAQ